MEIKLNVKDKSVNHFFAERLVGYRATDRRGSIDDDNPYYFMKDEIYLKKEVGLNDGELVRFELSDTSRMSQKELVNIYTYSVNPYYDISVKLVLEGFIIELVN